MWRMQGFLFAKQWRWAYGATTGHVLVRVPPAVHMSTDTNVLGARMRALPYNATSPKARSTSVGQLIFMDFQQGLPPSAMGGFTASCTISTITRNMGE